jgi:UDP-N-acetylmuramate--alanine ligase
VKAAFRTFVENIPFYGLAALCIDHPVVQSLIGEIEDRRVVTFGFSPQADVRALDVRFADGGARYDVVISDRATGETRTIADMRLPMPGEHNVSNSLAAIIAADEIGIDDAVIRKGLASFAGVKRRFTKTGAWNGVTIIDDYGHHPVEIAAVLKAARQSATGRVIAVVQPHRFTRLRDLFNEFCTSFNEADTVIVADVYAAGEAPIAGIDRTGLIDGLRARGHRHVVPLEGPEDLAKLVAGEAEPGDLVVCLGAGSITYWANALPEQLAALGAAPKRESRAS